MFVKDRDCSGGEGFFRGLATHDDAIITCVDSGLLKVWKDEPEQCVSILKQPFNPSNLS